MALGWIPGARQPDYGRVSTGDVASLTVAGATLLLADFTAALAWLTRRSIDATRREAEIATDALKASNRLATTAEQQAKITQELVTATNKQAEIAQEQLAASWRPIM